MCEHSAERNPRDFDPPFLVYSSFWSLSSIWFRGSLFQIIGESLWVLPDFVDAHIQGLDDGLVFLGQNHHLGPKIFLFFKVTKLPYHLVTSSPFRLYRKVTELLDFWDSQNLTRQENHVWDHWKNYLIRCIFFKYFMNQKIFEGDLVFFKNAIP
jgi:hypothetical protein